MEVAIANMEINPVFSVWRFIDWKKLRETDKIGKREKETTKQAEWDF